MNGSQPSRGSEGDAAELTVFVVDDEPVLLELATVVLESAGYRIRSFRDGGTALEAFKAAPAKPALVITDYAMHNMNGMEFMRECRRLSPRQKILLVSGTVDESIYFGSAVKPDRFLAKPYRAEQLTEAVNALARTSSAPF